MEKIFLDYELPREMIAQIPARRRSDSRMMTLDRETGKIEDRRFSDFPMYLKEGDLLVMNDTRVVPVKIPASKVDTGGRVELLFLKWTGPHWEGLVKGRVREGTRLMVEGWPEPLQVVGTGPGRVTVKAPCSGDPLKFFRKAGWPPLPPYIHRGRPGREEREMDKRRYQTVYAREHGSVAAPTAGLHFNRGMLKKIEETGAGIAYVTLHVGWGTFRPIRGDYHRHRLDPEWGRLTPDAAGAINRTLSGGGRVLAVGTTSARLLEARSAAERQVAPGEGWVDLFITPGHRFRVVEAMLTNFHLPRSSLLLLVGALAGSRLARKAYREALELNYRFYSYGDAMLIL